MSTETHHSGSSREPARRLGRLGAPSRIFVPGVPGVEEFPGIGGHLQVAIDTVSDRDTEVGVDITLGLEFVYSSAGNAGSRFVATTVDAHPVQTGERIHIDGSRVRVTTGGRDRQRASVAASLHAQRQCASQLGYRARR